MMDPVEPPSNKQTVQEPVPVAEPVPNIQPEQALTQAIDLDQVPSPILPSTQESNQGTEDQDHDSDNLDFSLLQDEPEDSEPEPQLDFNISSIGNIKLTDEEILQMDVKLLSPEEKARWSSLLNAIRQREYRVRQLATRPAEYVGTLFINLLPWLSVLIKFSL